MISLGIDPSLTSTGVIRMEHGKILEQKIIKTNPIRNAESKSQEGLLELERLLEIKNSIDIKNVDIVVLEGLAFMVKNTSALIQLSGLNYLIREKVRENNTPFIVVAPTTLKKFATGKGNSPKELLFLEVYKRYGLSFKNNDLCDAYVLARIREAMVAETKLTKFQQEVISLLKAKI